MVALLGPNGAGKTTTLETIAGLNHPISGTVELSGEKVGGTPAYQLAGRGLALVPEGRALFPGLTVREHLRLAGGRGGPGGRGGRGGRADRAAGPAPARTSCWRFFPSCASAWAARPACCPAGSSRCWPSAARW